MSIMMIMVLIIVRLSGDALPWIPVVVASRTAWSTLPADLAAEIDKASRSLLRLDEIKGSTALRVAIVPRRKYGSPGGASPR